METILKKDVILLSFNVTAYEVVKAVTPNSPFINDSHIKATSLLTIMLIEFSLFNLIFGHILKMGFRFVTVITSLLMVSHLLLDIACKNKIALISKNYSSYYSVLFPFLIAIFSIAGIVYLFCMG